MNWKEVGDWAFFACATVTALFALLYLFLAPWWRTETGRNIMAVMGSVALAFVYFAWVIAIGGVPVGFYPARVFLFSGITLAVGWRVWILIRNQVIRNLRGEQNELEDARQDDHGAAGSAGDGRHRRVPGGSR